MALHNLRAVVILVVVAVHAFLAYLGSATLIKFDKPPYSWREFPIVDGSRSFGFDIFAAWQDVYLMVLLFFLSAVFTWPSLKRRGTGKFLRDRGLRLGIPFLFGTVILMPLAIYPAYRTRAADPSLAAYVHHLVSLPFWDNGPMWFLWQLLALSLVAAALYRFAPRVVEWLGARSANAGAHPARYFLWFTAAALLAYVPLALAFTPMAWAGRGPLSLQFCRPLLYLVFYLAGLGVGARGFENGLLASDGALARGWARWLAGAALAFAVWLGLEGLSLIAHSGQFQLKITIDIAYAVAATSGCFAALALALRFASTSSRLLAPFAKNGFGLYVVHYPIAVWLQYALLGLALFAFAKAMIVFGLTLVSSLALVIALRRIPRLGPRLLGETSRPVVATFPRHLPERRERAATPLASNLR